MGAVLTFLSTLFVFSVVNGTPLLYGTLGEILTEKSGNMNLGVEGILFMGGAAGLGGAFYYEKLAGANASPFVALLLAVFFAFLAGALASLLFSFITITLRDIDYGIYPYTTSSNTIGAYAPIGAGIPGRKLNKSIGIMKAYSSCVGDGPFTTELAMTEEEKHLLREAGHEYGAATGRPRRVGPFDVVASRYGVQCQGCDELALTLFDVLDYMEEVPVVAQYKLADGTVTDRFPTGKTLDDAQPVVVKLPGWHCDITSVRKYEDLPEAARGYVEYLEKAVGCKIKYISVGPERDACIIRD